MVNIQQRLAQFMVQQGVSSRDAELAASRCAQAIQRYAAGGFSAGLALGLATRNPGALVMAVAAGAGGAAWAAVGSASCEEVRTAASKLAEEEFLRRPLR